MQFGVEMTVSGACGRQRIVECGLFGLQAGKFSEKGSRSVDKLSGRLSNTRFRAGNDVEGLGPMGS